jgi:hypothetical protein
VTADELKIIEERVKRAHREICDLAAGRRKWEMSIPVDAERDSDCVLQAPLDDVPRLIAEVKRLESEESDAHRLREAVKLVEYVDRSRGYPTPRQWAELVRVARAALTDKEAP